MSTRALKKPKAKGKSQVGPRIVRAWFDTVINPLLRALESESEFIRRNNWTWQFVPGSLEWIRPVQAHLSPASRDNLDHFLSFYPQFVDAIKTHDKEVERLAESCRQLQEALERSPELVKVFERATSPKSLEEMGTDMARLFGAYRPDEYLGVLAQHLVNSAGELPSYYAISPMWNRYRKEFFKVLRTSDLLPTHEQSGKAGMALLRSVDRLIRLLKDERLRLSLQHDVPYVTSSGALMEQENW